MSLYPNATLRFWANQSTEFARKRGERNYDLKTGKALAGHIKSAHSGVFSPTCPACKEMKAKQDQLCAQ